MIRKLAGGALALAFLAFAAGSASRPVLSDTLTWADAQFQALATRTAGVKGGDGLVGAPAFTFPAEATTGLYRPAANSLAVTVAGTEALRLANTALAVPTGTRFGLNAASDTFTANGLAIPNYGMAVGGSIAGGGGLHLAGYYAIGFYRAGAEVWRMAPDLLPATDNSVSLGSASQRARSLYSVTLNLTGSTAPTSSSDASGVVGDTRQVGNTLYWKTSSGWVRLVGGTF